MKVYNQSGTSGGTVVLAGHNTYTRCTVTVPAGAKADLTGHPASGLEKVDLVLGAGAALDLGGQDLTVRRFTGDRNAVTNGTLTELKPVAGIVIIVR